MKLVENYINRLGKFSQEPKDIGDKGYDIKYKYSIVKNIHYVACNIKEFELSAIHDKLLGWVLIIPLARNIILNLKWKILILFQLLSRAYYDKGQYHKAIQSLIETVKLESNVFYYWGFLGMAYNKNEQYQEAITTYREALELEPNHENIKEALKDLQKKIK